MKSCLTATFYAYKGGTGRTLALANVARYLAEEMGYRVGLVDLDIDSPGLVHEALCAELDSPCSAEKAGEEGSLRQAVDAQEGFLELFCNSIRQDQDAGSLQSNIDNHVIALNCSSGGTLLLMPAAQGSVSKPEWYGTKVDRFMRELASLDQIQPTGSAHSTPARICAGLFEAFADRYKLDFLFLDGRTGTGPLFPVYAYAVPHVLVLFVGLNEQNVRGSLSILNAVTEQATSPAPVFLVVSPVPTVGPTQLEDRLAYIATELEKLQRKRNPDANYIYKIPARIEHFLPYSDAAAFGEFYFPGKFPHSFLAAAQEKLARRIEQVVLRESLSADSAGEDHARVYERLTSHLSSPLIVATEIVHEDILGNLFKKAVLGNQPKPVFYGAEDEKAPWERAVSFAKDGEDKKLEELVGDPSFPDVLIIPQIHLEILSAALGGKFLNDLGAHRLADAQSGIDYSHLDSNYSNWRRWCTVGQKVVALPFSVNATLLCTNDKELSPFCARYWRNRGQSPKDPFFVPSSWHGLLELVRCSTVSRGLNSPFRIVGEGRGLYYEWLNVVTCFGGFDLEQVEGRVIQKLGFESQETLEATKLFVELARILPNRANSMMDQIINFGKGNLPMYVGWTDSFRFSWSEKSSLPIHTAVIRSEDSNSAVRLARCPRQMRTKRASLVDGWLMTFPKKKVQGNDVRLKSALALSRWFLDSAQQDCLLRQGFPTASTNVMNRAVETLGAARQADGAPAGVAERSYRVFLETLQAASADGNWVASPKTGVYETIVQILKELIDGQRQDASEALVQLAKEVRPLVEPRKTS